MRKKKENFLGQIKSKQSIMGTLVITLMLLATAIFFVGFVPEKVKAASTDYAYYKAITIESDYVSATLTNFPILVHDDTGNLSGNVLANGSDIAFYAVGNSTQYNHEVEYYNSTTGELWAWVNVTSIASGTDTLFYIYYDDSDGGYPVGHNPTSVWDGNYAGVFHFNGTMDDSTSNSKDLTNYGAASQTDGIAGGCYNFTNADSDYAGIDAITDISVLTQITIESWVRATEIGGTTLVSGIMIGEYSSTIVLDRDVIQFGIRRDNGHSQSDIGTPHGTDILIFQGTNQEFVNHVWSYAAIVIDANVGAHGTLWGFANGGFDGFDAETPEGAIDFSNIIVDNMTVGNFHYSEIDYYFNGSFDEVRISKILRNDSWVNASFHSQNETTGFLTLGTQQQAEDTSTFQIKGLPNDIITWQGTAGTSVYCNSTGDTNEWLEINMSINETDNVTEIRVWVGDLNDTEAYINASNITLYVTNAANITYYSFGAFTDGGSNITINQSTWNTNAYAITNPFNGTGLKGTNTSIFLIFKLAIPATSPTDIFWSTSSTVLKIYIGYLT